MDETKYLREDQWERIKDSLPGKAGDVGRPGDNRRFIEAVMWLGRTGAPWRELPRADGRWSGVHQRFRRWAKAGIWQMMFTTLAIDADTEWLMIDATLLRAPQHAAGATGGSRRRPEGVAEAGLPRTCMPCAMRWAIRSGSSGREANGMIGHTPRRCWKGSTPTPCLPTKAMMRMSWSNGFNRLEPWWCSHHGRIGRASATTTKRGTRSAIWWNGCWGTSSISVGWRRGTTRQRSPSCRSSNSRPVTYG